MGIDIRWENELDKRLEEIPDSRNCFAFALALVQLENTVCLRFIDPYGNTVLNQKQITVFINELQWLLQFVTTERVIKLVDKPFRVHNLKTGLVEYRVREKKLSVDEITEHLHKVLELAQRIKGETHTYLKFHGD